MLCHGPLHFIAFIQGFILVFSAYKKLCGESLCAVFFISVLSHKATIIFQRFGEGLCTGEMESFQETPNSLWVQRKGIMSVLFVHVGFYTSILFLFHILQALLWQSQSIYEETQCPFTLEDICLSVQGNNKYQQKSSFQHHTSEKGTILFSVPGCHIAMRSLQNVLYSTYCNCHSKEFCVMLQLVNYHETCLWVGLEPTEL